MPDNGFKEYTGRSLRDIVKVWKESYSLKFDIKEFSKQTWKVQCKNIEKEFKENKSLVRFLNELQKNKVLMGVGTSSFRHRAEGMLRLIKLNNYFSALVGAEDVHEHKPNPHVFLEVAKRLNVSPEKCVVVEDAPAGIEAAKRGNMKAIAYLTENHTKTELKEADLIITDFSEVSYTKIKEMF